jgi:hypothetical protein
MKLVWTDSSIEDLRSIREYFAYEKKRFTQSHKGRKAGKGITGACLGRALRLGAFP